MIPVGLAEIATMLDVQRATVDQWRQRDLLPEPRWMVGGRPAWTEEDIVQWAIATGRRSSEGRRDALVEHGCIVAHQHKCIDRSFERNGRRYPSSSFPTPIPGANGV